MKDIIKKITNGYKGFYSDLTTGGVHDRKIIQWKEGRTVRLRSKDKPFPCTQKALHFCMSARDVLTYYPPVDRGERNKFAIVQAKGSVEHDGNKSGCKALKVVKVFSSVWEFAFAFYDWFKVACRHQACPGWVTFESSPVAGTVSSHPVILNQSKSAVRSTYACIARSVDRSLLESDTLSVLLGGFDSLAASRECVVCEEDGMGPVYGEVTGHNGVAIALVQRSRGYLDHVWLRGVYNSTLIFLRPSYPPVIKVVDNKEIMEGKYYTIGVDGKIIAKED